MKNKLFMTFGGAVAAMCPWLARAETFPSDGNMLENTTYESAATYDNMGVYDGAVTAAAEYADALYNAAAGTYLPAASEDVATCPTGYYCPGLTNATYSETDNQGLNTCPDGYANSDAGASANTQCYTPCTDVSAFAHATAVTGNDYYGAGVDTCYATECVSGYHVNGGIEMVESDPLVPGADPNLYADLYGYIGADGVKYGESAFGLTENGTWAGIFEYGTVYGQASCQSEKGAAMVYYVSGILTSSAVNTETVRSELTAMVGESAADAVADVVAEYKAGTKTEEDATKAAYAILGVEENANFSTTDSGEYCYCQMTAYFASGSSELVPVTSAPWVFRTYYGSADGCAISCAHDCADSLDGYTTDSHAFRAAVLGTLGTRTVGVCAANEISITWDGADQTDIDANNAGTCTYDGDIRTPVKAQSVPGKIFKGWKFNK